MRWTNREVRNILRLLRRPHNLDRERLIIMLRECTHAKDGREALLFTIDAAFDRSDPHQLTRYETIRRVDIAGETTHSAAANMHVSVRQFFRYRSEAIAAIAQSIEKILRRPPDSHRHLLLLAKTIETIDPKAAREIYLRVPAQQGGKVAYNLVRTSLWAGVEVTQEQIDACQGPWRLMASAAVARHLIAGGKDEESATLRAQVREQLSGFSGPLYDEVAFELAAQDILDAHRRGDVARAGEITETVRALAGSNEYLLAFAMTIEAQQYILEGDQTAAALVLTDLEALEVYGRDHYIMARAAYCNAMLSLVRGFHEDAYAIANGARPAITALEAGFGFRAATIAGRAALLAGTSWTPPHDLLEKYPRLWTRPETEGVIARHMLSTDPAAARTLAEKALDDARRHESAVISNGIRAVIAAALDTEGRADDAQTVWLDVWEDALRLSDMFALYDMFVIPAAPKRDVGSLRLDDRFVSVLQQLIERTVPTYALSKKNNLDDVSMALLRSAVLAGTEKPEPHAKLLGQTQLAAAGLTRLRTSVDEARRCAFEARRVAARAVGWLLPPEARQAFNERWSTAWEIAVKHMHTSMGADDELGA
jgi:hypothetical protein